MDNFDSTYSDNSDHEINDTVHSNLLAAVSQLGCKQRVKPPSRKESSLQVSEFHLGKSGANKNAVLITNLAKSLGQQGSHAVITKQLRSVRRKARTLPRPLEKPVAARIQRTVGFRNVKNQLGRWDAVVHSNRAADQLTFPLKQSTVNFQTTDDFISKLKSQTRTPLEQQMDEILNNSPAVQEERKEEEEYKLSLAEMHERRREMAKLRAQQSYMAAKASRQKKIKSKKYHRILRRERIRQQLKDFEVLQKTDPEAALLQLEQLERTRAEERVSLRHRSTGQWARNKAVRAKYDKESRQELAQQLAVSRDLTQKIQIESSSDDEEEENDEKLIPADSDNPWIAPKTSTEVDEFVSAYRKYWEENNKKSLEQNGTINNSTSHNKGAEEREVGNEVKKEHTGNHETALPDKNVENENDKGTEADESHVGCHTSESGCAGGENNKDGLLAADVPVSEEQRHNSSKNNQAVTPDKQHSTFSRPEMQPEMKTSQDKENITTGQLCNTKEILPNGKTLTPYKQKGTAGGVKSSTLTQPQMKKLSPNKQKNTVKQETSITGVQPRNETLSLSDHRSMAEQENDSTEHVLQWKISPINKESTEEQKNFNIDKQPERMTLSPNQQKNISEEVNSITQVWQERKNVSQNKPISIAEQLNSNKKNTKYGTSSDSCKYKPSECDPVVIATTNSWIVTPIDVEVGTVGEFNGLGRKNKRNRRNSVENSAVKNKVKIDELFDDMEEKLKEKVSKKLKKLKVELKLKDENKTEEANSESDNEGPSLKLKQMYIRPDLDEELVEQPHDKIQEEESSHMSLSNIVAESTVQEEVQEPPVDNIDPNKFIAMKPKHLQTEFPDMVTRDEAIDDSEDESTERQRTITEAFAEDDVVAEFRKEKEEVTDKSQPQSVDLSLPGWGEWGGKNLPVSSRKKRRFIIKFPEVAPRKDANKGSVIINEEKNDKVVSHQVSELPFPFTSVKDFEASIRGPIGNTWIPETAHHTLIKPPVVTKLGTIIKPMDEDVLVKEKKKIKGMP